ncbi:hypothetical protein [Fredinandcohnia sp. 179-A 10B2 NHS]
MLNKEPEDKKKDTEENRVKRIVKELQSLGINATLCKRPTLQLTNK